MQTPFYVKVAEHLRSQGFTIVFVSLHEPSIPLIERAGFDVFNLYREARPLNSFAEADALAIVARFGVANVARAISHERYFYEIRDSAHLVAKLASYTVAFDSILERVADKGGPVALVQELGGFLGVLGGFYAARRRGMNALFIEPSFFRGRVFFTLNSLDAPRVPGSARGAGAEVSKYLRDTEAERKIVMPNKDASAYHAAWKKIVNRRNASRLIEKVVQKHVRGEREEFTHIAWYVRRHLSMFVNGWRLARHYRELPNRPFIYYPLHVPSDVALTLRSPEYLDQFGLIDYVARNTPATHVLAVKEHPAQRGAFSPTRIGEILRRHDNVIVLRPSLNNLDVIRQAAAIVTVNSKSGAEALLLNRPVVVLGDAFYRDSGLVSPVASLEDLAVALDNAVRGSPHSDEAIGRFFQGVWDSSHPGELYDSDHDNCRVFAQSLAEEIWRHTDVAGAGVRDPRWLQ